ncbi:hypothetical protein GCM10018953_06960 [Streptosporangium nondiastaticum]
MDFGDLGIRRQRPAQGVLAPAGTNHKNAHVREPIGPRRTVVLPVRRTAVTARSKLEGTRLLC